MFASYTRLSLHYCFPGLSDIKTIEHNTYSKLTIFLNIVLSLAEL